MKKTLIILAMIMILIIPISQVEAFEATDLINVLDGVEHGGGAGEQFGGGGADCNSLGELNTWLKNAFKFVQYAGVALAVVLSTMDFIQVIGGSKDDDLKNAFNRTVKRVIAVILLLLTGVLVGFIIDIVAPVTDIPNCVEGI